MEIEQIISKENILMDEPMSKHTTFKIGGEAEYFIKITDVQQLINLREYAKKNKIDFLVIGNGSNLLVRDEGIKGIVAKMCNQNYEIKEQADCIEVKVGAGMLIGKLAHILLKNEITGFECFAGIPGTIGGAVRMNAGAYGGEFKDIVVSTKMLDEDNNIVELSNESQKFSYRHSIFSENKNIIIETTLKLKKGKYDEIKEKMDEYSASRKTRQPLDMPSAGSSFKRGEDFITAKLIEEAGLKGYKIGGAQVSEKHSGFIVNTGNATAKDVIELSEYIKEQIYLKFGKKIELEIEVV